MVRTQPPRHGVSVSFLLRVQGGGRYAAGWFRADLRPSVKVREYLFGWFTVVTADRSTVPPVSPRDRRLELPALDAVGRRPLLRRARRTGERSPTRSRPHEMDVEPGEVSPDIRAILDQRSPCRPGSSTLLSMLNRASSSFACAGRRVRWAVPVASVRRLGGACGAVWRASSARPR